MPSFDRRTFGRIVAAGGAGLLAGPAAGTASADDEDCPDGLVTVESDEDFETTVAAVESAIEDRDLTVVATVDHAANAESVDLDLPPTTLFVFGNPAVGTQLMQAGRSVAIDLPQKMLVWEDGDSVFVTYNDPQYLADRHGVAGVDDVLENVSALLAAIAESPDCEE